MSDNWWAIILEWRGSCNWQGGVRTAFSALHLCYHYGGTYNSGAWGFHNRGADNSGTDNSGTYNSGTYNGGESRGLRRDLA